MGKIAIAVRGHERGAMTDPEFSDLVFDLSKKYDIELFIHTWNLSEASSSWRNVPNERFLITEKKIRAYFFRNEIKKIFIENDEEIELFGRINGRLGTITEIELSNKQILELIGSDLGSWANTRNFHLVSANKEKTFCFLQYGCPILPWKRMWHGIYTLINFINEYDKYDLILNIRFDILRYKRLFNPGSPLVNNVLVNKLISNSKPGNFFTFISNERASCIDNIYTGEPIPLLLLCQRFHFNLDELVESYGHNEWDGIQEHLVYLEAEKIRKSLKNKEITI